MHAREHARPSPTIAMRNCKCIWYKTYLYQSSKFALHISILLRYYQPSIVNCSRPLLRKKFWPSIPFWSDILIERWFQVVLLFVQLLVWLAWSVSQVLRLRMNRIGDTILLPVIVFPRTELKIRCHILNKLLWGRVTSDIINESFV